MTDLLSKVTHKPRVLLVLNRFRPMIGGAERQCELLVTQLQQRIDWVAVLTHRYDDSLEPAEHSGGLDIQRLGGPTAWKAAAPVSFYLALVGRLIVLRGRFDLIHCHTAGMTGLLVAIMGRLLGVPVLLKLTAAGELQHQVKPSSASRRLTARLKNAFRRVLGRLAVGADGTHVVGLTAQGGEEARDCGVRHIHVIPNGVDVERFLSVRRQPMAGCVRFGYCGRLTEEKGTHVLAAAFAAVMPKESRVTFDVAGSGDRQLASSEERLKTLSQAMPDRVRLHGSVSDTPGFLSGLDVYISASTYEGLPNAVLEALACGLPCVLSDIDAHRELIRLNPEATIALFPAEDEAACVATIRAVLAAWPLVNSRLSPELLMNRVADRYFSLYQSMLALEQEFP